MATPTPNYDLVIAGAGIHGLILAQTYLSTSPTSRLLILDSASSIGGVWAQERLYPGLKTNNLVGSYEFSEFPLDAARYGLRPGEHIPGPVVHEYLQDFAERFGLVRHVRLRTVLETAERVEGGSWRLTITTSATTTTTTSTTARTAQSGNSSPPPSASQDAPTTTTAIIHTARLVLATGLTSQPSIPTFPAQHLFDRPILHSLDLRRSAAFLSTARRIVVLGGNKSAFDAAYSAATSASSETVVHMVMRPSGGGPSWVWPVTITPLSLSVQRMATTRLFALMDPTPWTLSVTSHHQRHGSSNRALFWPWGLLRWFLHRTFLGRLLVTAFWAAIGSFIARANGYASHPEVAKLRPWTSVAWMGNSLSIHNYTTDFFGLVRRGRIKVHVADIARLGPGGAVYLSDNTTIAGVDALLCCTGWKVAPTVRFLPEGLARRLGVPGLFTEEDAIEIEDPAADISDTDVQVARAQIRRETPMLRHEPTRTLPVSVPQPTPVPPPGAAHKQHQQDHKSSPSSSSKTELSPAASCWRLYRFLVPVPSAANPQRNIAFMGTHLSVAATLVAQAQALWLTAYFLHDDDNDTTKSNDTRDSTPPSSPTQTLPLPAPSEMKRRMLLNTEYQRLRHPAGGGGSGERCPDLVFDSLGYIDALLGDVGVEMRRKAVSRKLGWWAELVGRYWPRDYEGVVREWMVLMERRRREKEMGMDKAAEEMEVNGVAG